MGRARPPSGLRHYHRPVVLKSSSELRVTSDGVTSIGSLILALALSLSTFTLCRFSDSEPRNRRLVFLRIRVGQEATLEALKLPNFQVCQIAQNRHVADDPRRPSQQRVDEHAPLPVHRRLLAVVVRPVKELSSRRVHRGQKRQTLLDGLPFG